DPWCPAVAAEWERAVKPISYGPGFETLLTCLDQFPLPQSETSRVEQSGSRHELHAGAKKRKVVKGQQMRGKHQRLCPGIRELARAPAWSWSETFLGPGLIKARNLWKSPGVPISKKGWELGNEAIRALDASAFGKT